MLCVKNRGLLSLEALAAFAALAIIASAAFSMNFSTSHRIYNAEFLQIQRMDDLLILWAREETQIHPMAHDVKDAFPGKDFEIKKGEEKFESGKVEVGIAREIVVFSNGKKAKISLAVER